MRAKVSSGPVVGKRSTSSTTSGDVRDATPQTIFVPPVSTPMTLNSRSSSWPARCGDRCADRRRGVWDGPGPGVKDTAHARRRA